MEMSASSSDNGTGEIAEDASNDEGTFDNGTENVPEGPNTTENILVPVFVKQREAARSNMEPEVGMVFDSEDQAYLFYNYYAQRKDVTKRKQENARTNCMARIEFKVGRDGVWLVSKVIYEHNHLLVLPHKAHLLRSHRKSTVAQQNEMGEDSNEPAEAPEFPLEAAREAESVGFLLKDRSNYLHTTRMRELEKGDAQFLLEYLKAKQLEDPSFFYAEQLDDREQSPFSATMDTLQWTENMRSHFKKLFNSKLPLSKFIEQYYKTLIRFREKELYEDHKSRQSKPILLVDVPMLNEAAQSYTRLMYSDFEGEFKSQLSCLCEPVAVKTPWLLPAVVQERMYAFGVNHNGRYLGDIQVLDFKSLSRSKLEAKTQSGFSESAETVSVAPCAGHSLILSGNQIQSLLGHTRGHTESLIVKEFYPLTCTWSTLCTYGRSPSSRGGQSLTLVADTYGRPGMTEVWIFSKKHCQLAHNFLISRIVKLV